MNDHSLTVLDGEHPQAPCTIHRSLKNATPFDRREFMKHLQHLSPEVEEKSVSCPSIWLEGDNESYAGLVPVNALEKIASWVTEKYS